jgi:hypothetical protein
VYGYAHPVRAAFALHEQGMFMRDRDPSPQDLPRLRRNAYEFLRRYAAVAWEERHGDNRWEIDLPPEVEALPERKRFRAQARQEARRVADAQLYDVCAGLTQRAALLGAAIREDRHEEAVALAGRPNVVETLGIQAPAVSGFLRWRDPNGVGYNARGVPLVACHWGPAAGQGRWLVWWSDNYGMAKGYAADARAHDEQAWRYMSVGLLPMFGPLWYDRQQLLRPYDGGPPESEPADGDVDLSDTALIYTTLATWWLLSTPDSAIDLSEVSASAAEQAADRAVGLHSGPITVAAAARVTS